MTGQLHIPVPVCGVIDPAAAERAKQSGMARAAQLDPDWAADCDERIARFAARGVPFQAADLVADGLDEPPHPNCWGSRLKAAAAAGLIRFHRYAPSRRATVHKSICAEWIGCPGGERTE
ncbi:hypothetical protein [Streptomyces boncukensis]|uniref:Uncharacterized protein n=1 Tax=Streptomyces boncukensis TaxID=2711219 RepID=A0A6G4X7E8_9ACTN|nr:hypothetical protein [Streptomyces boncukensis]NGO73466.1 hypothetical protein [Streptomyces boncukensis]